MKQASMAMLLLFGWLLLASSASANEAKAPHVEATIQAASCQDHTVRAVIRSGEDDAVVDLFVADDNHWVPLGQPVDLATVKLPHQLIFEQPLGTSGEFAVGAEWLGGHGGFAAINPVWSDLSDCTTAAGPLIETDVVGDTSSTLVSLDEEEDFSSFYGKKPVALGTTSTLGRLMVSPWTMIGGILSAVVMILLALTGYTNGPESVRRSQMEL